MGLHNSTIYNEHSTKKNSLEIVVFFFSFCCNFSNVRVERPWRKHKPKVSQIENKLQVDKSKTKEKKNENVIVEEN
jgi:hypothetical protein